MPGKEPDPSILAVENWSLRPSGLRPSAPSSPRDIPPGSAVHVKDIRPGSVPSTPISLPPRGNPPGASGPGSVAAPEIRGGVAPGPPAAKPSVPKEPRRTGG